MPDSKPDELVNNSPDSKPADTKPKTDQLPPVPGNPAAPIADAAPPPTNSQPEKTKPDTGELVVSPSAPPLPMPSTDSVQSAEDERILAAHSASAEPVALTCPVCGLVNRPGELVCSRCGTILATGGATKQLGQQDMPNKPKSWPTGDVIVTEQDPIVLEIEGQQMTVPVAEVITIGRVSDIPDDSRPDVDLSQFGAGDKGVSRKHIKIKRKNILIYVADLGSTNGTLLNGRRLIPNAERLLRNGDELQLGRLKMKVKF